MAKVRPSPTAADQEAGYACVCHPREQTRARNRSAASESLHRSATFVGRLPFGKQRAGSSSDQPCGLLGDVHIEPRRRLKIAADRERKQDLTSWRCTFFQNLRIGLRGGQAFILQRPMAETTYFPTPPHPRSGADLRHAAGACRAHAGRRATASISAGLWRSDVHEFMPAGAGGGVVADRDGWRSSAATSPPP